MFEHTAPHRISTLPLFKPVEATAALPRTLEFSRPPHRVLVVVTRRIGDVLLATPVVRSLKAAWPESQIDMLVFAGTQGFVSGSPDIAQVITIVERPTRREHLRLMLRIRRRYDLALSLVPGDRPTLYAYLAGRRRAGLLIDSRKHWWKRTLLDAWVPFDGLNTHTVLMHLALLRAIGVAPVREVVPSFTPDDEAAAQAELAVLEGAPYAVLHPYPKFRYKMWHEQGWGEVGNWLRAEGLRVVITGGPDADERAYASRVAGAIDGVLDLSGQFTLGALAAVLSRAALYVGPDTAVTHAAAALGIPTIALFGPSDPVKWGPWPAGYDSDRNPWRRHGDQRVNQVRLIQGRARCVPCMREGCEGHIESSSDCLTHLSPRIVIAAARDLGVSGPFRRQDDANGA
jgi:heptosyltransferase III